MTKKDYVLIADSLVEGLRDLRHYLNSEQLNRVKLDIGRSLEASLSLDNPRFDSLKFETYIDEKLGVINDTSRLSEEAV